MPKKMEAPPTTSSFVKDVVLTITRGGFGLALKQLMESPLCVQQVARVMAESEFKRTGADASWEKLATNEQSLWCLRATDAMRGVRSLVRLEV